ncbi:MAG: lactonase family protein [Lachnospiraceae bacterium]|nr:lactonase family protein [Lachnospiraceae bacterium]MBO5145367.1 lactonase family protein [Lachnospiraceae bacterium]
MGEKKCVAYVSTYTMGDKHGIKIYDVDMENGRFFEKGEVEITNSSYVTISHNRKYLYAITDFGVESFKILQDGNLERINRASTNGMRGCYLSTDYDDKFLFCAGYHDGKITVLRLDAETGAVGAITDEVFHKGLGSIAERSFRPHISCVKMTRDNKYLCAADLGIDYVNVYRVDHERGTLRQVDIIRCDLESAPRHLKFSEDGRFLYIISEMKNCIDVYEYHEENKMPFFDLIQTVPTSDKFEVKGVAASALNISNDGKYILASTAGENSVTLFEINQKSGELKRLFCLPISGEYPKDAALFPDNRHLVSLNHESNTMTFFTVDYENNCIIMNGKEIPIKQANCIIFHELD